MSNAFWRPSPDQRRTILLLEALGLIHDLGKLSDTFLQSQAPSSTQAYNHNLLADPRQIQLYKGFASTSSNPATSEVQEWLKEAKKSCAFGERPDLTAILDHIQFTDWTGQTYSFAELVPLAAKPSLARGQNAISPSDWQQVLGKDMQPGLLIGALHGVAHIEKEGDPQQHKQPYTDVFRASPFGLEERIQTGLKQELTDALKSLPLADINQITTTQRREWLEKMREGMCRGLADNRRPHNEVSLWDWGYTVATMAKAAAAYIYKNGWPADLNCSSFRTLRITLNRLERYTHSDKISDLLGIRRALDDAFEQVRQLLEETCALGNLFYRDESGDYYLFPDLGYDEATMAALRREIQNNFPADLQPQVHWCEPVTAGNLDKDKKLSRKLVAEPRQQALQEPPVRADNNFYPFAAEWSEERPENAEICTVCGVRPVGYPRQGSAPKVERELADWATEDKAKQRNVCRICLDRRGRRAQEWAEKGLQGTIWMDEVADDNGRAALFVGKLGLEGWLDGVLLDTIQVTKDTTKTPSPARLYRIAETARAFWESMSERLTPSVVKQRSCRLALYPDNLPDLGDFHAYELDVDGIALSVVWDKPNSRFLTAENLTYFAQCWQRSPDELPNRLQGQAFDILEPSEYGRPGQSLLKVQIKRVETLDGYYPIIPLLAEPTVCMVLVPADKALALARAVQQEYEKQMGRVRERLPLYLGLVFCQRRTPIRTVLGAGRSMLEMAGPFDMNTGAGWEGWRLIGKNLPNPGECELSFDNGITWRVPVLAGDCNTRDNWYPRLYEGDTWNKKQAKHVDDLRVRTPQIPPDKGWKTWVRPSRFDFEFLDTTARRFEIHYDANGRRPRRTRPFYLEDLDRLEELWTYMKRLAKTQRHQVIRTVEATREAWYGQDPDGKSTTDGVFRQFVADTLAGAAWPKAQPWHSIPGEWREKLIEAGSHGELADLAELHMEILKE